VSVKKELRKSKSKVESKTEFSHGDRKGKRQWLCTTRLFLPTIWHTSKARQMHSDGSIAASKKRKRVEPSEDDPERERTSSIIRRSIALVTAIPEIPAAALHPLLNTLTDAYGSALSEEASDSEAPFQQVPSEDWNWELTAEQIARLSEEELTIWKDLLACRHDLCLSVSFYQISGIFGLNVALSRASN
jgi:hypothetical protein